MIATIIDLLGKICYDSLSGIIRTRLSGRLIRSDCFLFIDGRQPICFI